MAAIQGVSGLASGLDTASMVDAIMKAARASTKQIETRAALYKSRSDLIKTFNTKILTAQLDLSSLKQASTFAAPTATSSNASVLTASALSTALTGSFQLTVDRVAAAQQLSSGGFSSSTASIGTGSVVVRLGTKAPVTVNIDSAHGTLSGLADSINQANAGVRAQVINDGSSTPYHLLLSSTTTGSSNTVSFDASGLSGGQSDQLKDVTATSLGSTATMSLLGRSTATNGPKVYQVKAADSGAVGTANLQTRSSSDNGSTWSAWSTAAASSTDAVSLGDGVSFKLAAGDLVANETFTLRPMQQLSAAADAQIKYGATGSTLTVTSATNTLTDLVPGVTLNLKDASTTPVTVTIATQSTGAKDAVKSFLKSYNDALDFWKANASYDGATGKAGALFGESELRRNLDALASALTNQVPGVGSTATIGQLGVAFNNNTGHMEMTESTFDSALAADPNAVAKVFANTGSSTNDLVRFGALSSKTQSGSYQVSISQAASQALMTAGGDLAETRTIDGTNNLLRLKVNGTSVALTLSPGSYSRQGLVDHVQSLLDNALTSASDKINATLNGNRLELRSRAYGSSQSIVMGAGSSALDALGLTSATTRVGQDVAGTIGGILAKGQGQVLSGATGSPAEGLRLLVTATGPLGSVVVKASKGVAQMADTALQQMTDSTTGSLFLRADTYTTQSTDLTEQIKKNDSMLAIRRFRLEKQFLAMENTIAQFNSLGSQLSAMLGMGTSNSSNKK